jgi:predicted Fe-S protein YdhL (DUF1289 family)
MVKSPCVNICTMKKGVCVGCDRTSEEITNWLKYSDKKKKEILRKILDRTSDEEYYGFPY